MKKILRHFISIFLASACVSASGQTSQLTSLIPECRMPPGSVLPKKYYRIVRSGGFKWVAKATAGDRVLEGDGWERVDGSDNRDWFTFYRIDLNGDGLCDWYLNSLAPMSSGGDRDSINTLYLGGVAGWSRIGAQVAENKPDILGVGKSIQQQDQFLFGEEPSVIYDATNKITYIIAALYNRNVQRDQRPGYRIFDWAADKKTLRLLDKWEPNSRAAAVYAFFKAHGGSAPSNSPAAASSEIQTFDREVEDFELQQACDPAREPGETSPEPDTVVSKYLLARCKK